MASAAQRRIKSISYAKYGYMFIAPFFLVYCFFQIWPLLQTFILSFQGNGADAGTFVGFDNYATILFGSGEGMGRRAKAMQELFLTSFKNTIILWFGNFIPQILLSLLLAVWFTDSKLHIPGVGFFKVVMYLPNIITAVSVAALFMRFISNSQLSAVNTLLLLNGSDSVNFETSAVWSRGIVMFIQTWLWFGNTMIMMMSGIMGINPSLFEAAAIDGASSGQVLRKVTLPLLRPMVVYTLITSMIGGLQMFDIPYLYHTGAGKINANLRTVAVFVYEQFRAGAKVHQPDYGIAGAASVILFIITAALGILVFRMNRDEDEHRKKKERKALVKEYKKQQKLAKNGGLGA
ncbi:MAG: sugar ABC transporter permease [Ruminococcus callidus]|nr:sugar ABC transporter permease [Ruminococcus callidus]MDY3654791.1 sugar ABC transporter permease [Ruminococcus callidus]MDY4018932.1 sugar ABC transporter permease [Ruminococcus callidus]